MSLNVGELVGYLRLDMGDFETGMAKGTALADGSMLPVPGSRLGRHFQQT